jgi:PiT family inorganic phosphate transporter
MAALAKNITNKKIFDEPNRDSPPPLIMRILLIITCTLVSFFHGSNDGQKGVGLVMIILIAIIPGYFALDQSINTTTISESLTKLEVIISKIDTTSLKDKDLASFIKSKKKVSDAKYLIGSSSTVFEIKEADRFKVRKNIVSFAKALEKLLETGKLNLSKAESAELKKELKSCKKITDYSPFWVLVMISLSIGIGTMIGWKRIVRTIGEKIGKTHMSYAQGFSAEVVASSTIGLSTWLGLPVSTTHVLSSGIAGAMVSGKGLKNLQPKTIRNILLAWLLTLPVCMLLAFGLFWLFRALMV